jgi:hypothetical protein
MIGDQTCQTCGMLLDDPGEFHPFAFCIWKRAGQPPWETLVAINSRLGIDVTHWPTKPPLVRDLPEVGS